MRIVPSGPSDTRSKLSMKPSSWRIRAIACFVRDAGTSTVLWFAVLALRMRVSISAIGSVIDMCSSPSPRRLRHARHDAGVRVLPKADAAHRKLAQIAARPPADPAPVVAAHLELRRATRLDDQTGLCHSCYLRFPGGAGAGFCSGRPIAVKNSEASSSVLALVTIVTSMPRVLSTLS